MLMTSFPPATAAPEITCDVLSTCSLESWWIMVDHGGKFSRNIRLRPRELISGNSTTQRDALNALYTCHHYSSLVHHLSVESLESSAILHHHQAGETDTILIKLELMILLSVASHYDFDRHKYGHVWSCHMTVSNLPEKEEATAASFFDLC